MHKKLLLVILCLCINYAQAAPVTNFSGLFLGEIIYSDTNQTTGYRFSNKQTYNSFCFPRAILNIDSILNEQLDFHISFNFRESCGYGGKNDEWNFRKFGYTDEGYIKYSTQYARADVTGALGVMYVPYGDYLRHSIPLSLTQALTQTQAASAVANFKVNNLTLDFFVFNSKTYSGYSNFINNFDNYKEFLTKNIFSYIDNYSRKPNNHNDSHIIKTYKPIIPKYEIKKENVDLNYYPLSLIEFFNDQNDTYIFWMGVGFILGILLTIIFFDC
jgi:hypothetical protein